jgi:hypothetical protein
MLLLLLLFVAVTSAFVLEIERNGPEQRHRSTHALGGDIDRFGVYWVGIQVAGRQHWVHLDTASSDLLIYGANCTSCSQYARKYSVTPTFQPIQNKNVSYRCLNSAASASAPCTFYQAYIDASYVSGFVATERITFAPNYTVTAPFGVITLASPNFEPPQLDGIFGLCKRKISAFSGSTVATPFEAISNEYPSVFPRWFSICLNEQGGRLSVGEPYVASSYRWTPQLNTQGFYGVGVTRLDIRPLNGVSYALDVTSTVWSSTRVLIDSGTPTVILPSSHYGKLKTRLRSLCGLSATSSSSWIGICGTNQELLNGNSVYLTSAQFSKFPRLHFHFRNIASSLPVVVRPEAYLIPVSASTTVGYSGLYYFGIRASTTSSTIYLGDVFLRNCVTLFDNVNNRIGFGAGSLTC